MKNKEIAAAAIGGVFFAVPYLGLAIPLVPSLLIGAAAFGAGELAFGDGKLSLKDKDPSLYQVLEKAKKQNAHILDMIPKIEKESLQKELNEINDSVGKIIKTIEKEPKKLKKANNLFDYYLPVTIKIIDRYDEIENQKLSSAESKKFFESTDKMISEVNKSYKKILAELYKSDIVDMDAEMKVLNSLLKADGFDDTEIDVKKEEE